MKALIFATLLAVGCTCPKILSQGEAYLVTKSTEAFDRLTERDGYICRCVNISDGQTVFEFFTTEGCAVGDSLRTEIKFLN